MRLICELAAPFVANAAVEQRRVNRPLRSHVDHCLKCQARQAAMSKTARALTAMRSDQLRAPSDFEWRVMSSLEGDLAISPAWRRPVTWLAAGVSMAALLIWRLKPRTS